MRYFIIILLLFIISCSSNSDDVKNDTKKAPANKTLNLNTNYQYEKLDVSKLYNSKDKEILKKIDLSGIKNIKESLLYSMEDKVYIERSPFEVYELLIKKAKKRTIEDNILFLKLSLELGKDKYISLLLDYFKNKDLIISDIKKVDMILARFNLFDKEIKFLSSKLDRLLKNKKIDENNTNNFFSLIKLLDNIKDLNLLKSNNNKYFIKYLKINEFNERVNRKYISELIKEKKYLEAEGFIIKLLKKIRKKNIHYDKSSLLLSLVEIYKKTKEISKIRDLYLSNTKLPENKDLFYEYIGYLKRNKTWLKELKLFIKNFNREKSLSSFYMYYYSLKYENKTINNLLDDYYNYILKNRDEDATKDISLLLISNGKYNKAFNLLNIGLLNYKNSKYYDDYIINMAKVINVLPYKERMYSSYYFFSTPEIIGGVLSLLQNQYKDNNFLLTIDNQNNLKSRINDMNYLFDKYKNSFNSNDKLTDFLKIYFSFIRRYKNKSKIRELVAILQKLNKDPYFNIFLLKTLNISNNKNKIYKLYLKLLKDNKNNKEKYSKYMNELLGFINNFNLATSITKVNDLIKLYPNNEKLYEKLLYLLGSYRAYNKELGVYEQALKRFNKKTWADKYSRFLIRRKWNSEMSELNKKLIKLLNKDEYQQYLTRVFSSKKYGAFDSPFNSLYEKVYIDALKKYPFNKTIINKLLQFYDNFRYSYRYKSSVATSKYAWLLYKYIYIFDNFRDRYFRDRLITKNMNHDVIIKSVLKKKKLTIPDLKYLAYMLEYKGEFEKSVKYYAILSKYYLTDRNIIFKTAKLYKSLASSFYIEDSSFLDKSEVLYKRLSFLYRNKSKYYISLAELYYELMLKDKAKKTLFRALEFQKGNKQKYVDIANMFYDYYDYDNALKTIYIYRNRKDNDDLLIPFVGKLFELKSKDDLAINEYFRDLLNKNNDSYQSEKRLKVLINKKTLKKIIILKIEENINYVIKDEILFNKFRNFLLSINNSKLLSKLYTSLYKNSTNIKLLKQLYYILKDNKDSRLVSLLKKIERLDKNDDIYYMIISYYKDVKNIKEVSNYYEKLLLINSYENDKYRFVNIMEEFIAYLNKNKQYEASINKYNDLLIKIKDKKEQLTYKLELSNIYKLQSDDKYIKYLLLLDKEYPLNRNLSNIIFSYYKSVNQIEKMVDYLSGLIKRIKKENSLSYNEKKYRIADYRGILIEQLIILKKYHSVLDQYIEVLNRNPLDGTMIKKVYNFVKTNKISSKLFDYYSLLSKKSFKNYKYLLLNANLNLLKGDFNKSLEYYQKAERLEPQNISIKYNIAETFIKLKKYQEAYDLYNKLYIKEDAKLTKEYILKRMFVISMYLKNIKLIEDLAFQVSNYDNSFFIAKTLYQFNYLNLAREYYKKIIKKSISSFNYLNETVIYQYSRTFINKSQGLDLMKDVLSLVSELDYLDKTRYRYLMFSNERILFKIITDYIPDNISYFTNNEIESMNEYIDDLDYKYNKYSSIYFKKLNLIDKYFTKLTGNYINNTKKQYYKSVIDYDSILSQELYRVYGYQNKENLTASKYNKAFLFYTWRTEDRAFNILKTNVYECNKVNKNNIAINTYIEYLRKNKLNKYKNLISNTCIYSNILSNFIKHKEKKLAIELINFQKNSKSWTLKEKIKLYLSLKEFDQEGVELYTELLKLNSVISDEIKGKSLLGETEWNNTLKKYYDYLLKANLTKDLSSYIDNITETSPKSIKSYITISNIYSKNKKYRKSIEYLKYAKQLSNKIIIDIYLANDYLKLDNLSEFNKVKNKIIKSTNLNDYKKFYNILKENKKLDSYFISSYSDLLVKNYKSYGYYKLISFIKQITDYYNDKSISQLVLFVNNFKDVKSEIYKTILFDKKNSFSNNYKIKLFNEIIKYFSKTGNLYEERTWVLSRAEFLSMINQNDGAINYLSKYKSIFTYEEELKYNFYMFKFYYLNKDISMAKTLFANAIKNNSYDYGIKKYYNFVISNNKKYKKEFLLSFYDDLKNDYKFNINDLKNMLNLFDDNKLRIEILYLINNLNISLNDYDIFEKLISNRKLEDLYKVVLENKFSKFYNNYNYKKMNGYNDNYYKYIFTLIKMNKQKKLNEVLSNRKLSVYDLKLIENYIDILSYNEKKLILFNMNFDNFDIYYIKALLNYSLERYDMALIQLNKIDVNQDYKYNLIMPILKVKILSKLNQLKEVEVIKRAIKISPDNSNLKLILFKYYININKNKKALFVLGDMGLNLYLAFDSIVSKNFTYSYLANNDYNDYYENDYYDDYSPEKIVEKVFSVNKAKAYPYVDNFISKFNKKDKKIIVKFLYEQYKKYSNDKRLGLAILYSYSKLDDNYKEEYKKLLKEK